MRSVMTEEEEITALLAAIDRFERAIRDPRMSARKRKDFAKILETLRQMRADLTARIKH
jgi:hypothetical protein